MSKRLDYSNQNRSNKKAREGISDGELKAFKAEADALANRIAEGRPSKSITALNSGPVIARKPSKEEQEEILKKYGLK